MLFPQEEEEVASGVEVVTASEVVVVDLTEKLILGVPHGEEEEVVQK